MNHLRNFRRYATAYPDESARSVGKRTAQVGGIEVGQNRDELLDQFVAIKHDAGVRENRRRLQIRCEQPAIAIDDIGTAEACRHRLGKRQRDVRLMTESQRDELNGHLGKCEKQDGENAGLRQPSRLPLPRHVTISRTLNCSIALNDGHRRFPDDR